MKKIKDRTGVRFGRLIALEPRRTVSGKPAWLCRYECGEERVVVTSNLISGNTKSCGCLNAELSLKRATTHGQSRPGQWSPLYKKWASMIRRCTNKKEKAYKHYGARGIKVCDRWRNSFEKFAADMGEVPPHGTLERIDNDDDYHPSNCRWATMKEQARNRRSNRIIVVHGDSKTMAEWAEVTGLAYSTIKSRLKYGWSPERAVSTVEGVRSS